MDGLVSNFALIMGVSGGSSGTEPVVLAGLAGLAAGSFSMAVGEYTSVASQTEAALKQAGIERREIVENQVAEQAELAARFEDLGIEKNLALRAARQVHQNPESAVRLHVLQEMGVSLDELASPKVAAISSFVAFGLGALLPLLPFLLGATTGLASIVVSLIALFMCGAIVTKVTSQWWWMGGLRQLVLGGVAASLTYAIGSLIGG